MVHLDRLNTSIAEAVDCLMAVFFDTEHGETDVFYRSNSLKFETLESRVLLSASMEIVQAPPDPNQPAASIHYDLNDKAPTELSLLSRSPEANFDTGKFTPDATPIKPSWNANSILTELPPEQATRGDTTSHASVSRLRTEHTYPTHVFAPATSLTSADAILFNNASTVATGATPADNQPTPVNPDPIPHDKLDPSIWGDWMPSYQVQLRTTEQTQISMGTSSAGHGSNTSNSGTLPSMATQALSSTDAFASHDKGRYSPPQNGSDTLPTPPSQKKAALLTTSQPGMGGGKTDNWRREFVGITVPKISPSTQIQIDPSVEAQTGSVPLSLSKSRIQQS